MHLLDTKGLVSIMTMTAPKADTPKAHGKVLYIREPHISKNPVENEVFHQAEKAEQELVNHDLDARKASALTYGILCHESKIEPEEAVKEIPDEAKNRYGKFIEALTRYRNQFKEPDFGK